MRELDLPLDDAPLNRVLVWIVAGLTFLAILAAAAAAVADGRLRALMREPMLVTVAMPPPSANLGTDGSTDLEQVVALLRSQPGIAFVDPLSDAELGKLVEPWLSDIEAKEAMPMPRLIDLGFNPGSRPDIEALAAELQQLAPGTTIGEAGELEATRIAFHQATRLVAAAVSGLAMMLAIIAVIVVTRINLRLQGDSIGLLRLMGARDTYVARQFEQHALSQAFRGGLVGFALAAIVLLTVLHGMRFMPWELAFELRLRSLDWVILAAVPMLTALLVALAVRITAQLGLARNP